MSQQRVCRALQESGDYLSGQELSRTLGISRAAVWKAVEALRRQGYDIEARTGRGYRLIGAPDLLSRETVEQYLHRTRENLHVLETVDSTNSFCRRLALEGTPDGTAVLADCQTAGRGRRGRSFQSPAGKGLFFSVLWRPDCAPEELLPLTALSAVAVCRAIQRVTGVRPQIKWPNDLVLGGRKLAGILTEMSLEGESGHVSHVVVGIGINLAQPQEYFDAAGLPHGTSLALQGVPVDMDTDPEWLAQYMTDFGFDRALYTYEAEGFAPYRERYKALCVNLGRRVTYDGGAGTAVDVDDEGRLIVRDETGDTRVFTGEVSVKGIYGAV